MTTMSEQRAESILSQKAALVAQHIQKIELLDLNYICVIENVLRQKTTLLSQNKKELEIGLMNLEKTSGISMGLMPTDIPNTSTSPQMNVIRTITNLIPPQLRKTQPLAINNSMEPSISPLNPRLAQDVKSIRDKIPSLHHPFLNQRNNDNNDSAAMSPITPITPRSGMQQLNANNLRVPKRNFIKIESDVDDEEINKIPRPIVHITNQHIQHIHQKHDNHHVIKRQIEDHHHHHDNRKYVTNHNNNTITHNNHNHNVTNNTTNNHQQYNTTNNQKYVTTTNNHQQYATIGKYEESDDDEQGMWI